MSILAVYKDEIAKLQKKKESKDVKKVLIRKLPLSLHTKIRLLSIHSGYTMEDIIILSIELLFQDILRREAEKILNLENLKKLEKEKKIEKEEKEREKKEEKKEEKENGYRFN